VKIGDLVILKSNPNAMGIITSFYIDICYPDFEHTEERYEMAMVLWNIESYHHGFELSRLKVIG